MSDPTLAETLRLSKLEEDRNVKRKQLEDLKHQKLSIEAEMRSLAIELECLDEEIEGKKPSQTTVPFTKGKGKKDYADHPGKVSFRREIEARSRDYFCGSKKDKGEIVENIKKKFRFVLMEEGKEIDDDKPANLRITNAFSKLKSDGQDRYRKKMKMERPALPRTQPNVNEDHEADRFREALINIKQKHGGSSYVNGLSECVKNHTQVVVKRIEKVRVKREEVSAELVSILQKGQALPTGVTSGTPVFSGNFAVQLKMPNGTSINYLAIKGSTKEKAGLGVFADRPFKYGDLIGAYCGEFVEGEPGSPDERDYTVELKNGKGYVKASQTIDWMGMHLLNDYYNKSGGSKNSKPLRKGYNVEMDDNLLIWAVRDIEYGEELFLSYNGV